VIKFPGPDDRLYILGRTKQGKTTAALWHLSGHDFRSQPWCIFDTKGDPNIDWLCNSLPQIKEIGVFDTPGETGLYHVRPTRDQMQEVDAMLGRIWDNQNCGVFIDEGYTIIPNSNLIACLTQGRTRKIPMIVLTQRPAWITKFVESEADFVQVFNLSRRDDRKKVADVVHGLNVDYRLDRYCSYWYNVGDDELVQFGPVPDKTVILQNFRASLPPEDDADAQPIGQPERQSAGKRVI
jgi:hypothetical protein